MEVTERPSMTLKQIAAGGDQIARFPELNATITEAAFDLPDKPPLWAASDAALIDAVRAAEGRVAIIFKRPGDAKAMISGREPAMNKEDVLAGRNAVEALGVKFTTTFRTTSLAFAKIDPAVAPQLRDHARVAYLEPVGTPGRVVSTPLSTIPPSAVHLRRSAQQDTTWGVLKANAPKVWSEGYRGEGRHITILDSGVDSAHAVSIGQGDANGFNSQVSTFSCFYCPLHGLL